MSIWSVSTLGVDCKGSRFDLMKAICCTQLLYIQTDEQFVFGNGKSL